MKSRDLLKKKSKKFSNEWHIKIDPDLMQQHIRVNIPEPVYEAQDGFYDQNMNKIPKDRYH